MSILKNIQDCVENTFGIVTLKPYQLLITHRIVEQFDSDNLSNQIVILPTGSGKSLCFLVPAVLCKKKTVIIYPLLALMNDQTEKLIAHGIDCVVLRGNQTKQERDKIFAKLRSGTKIIITNPETLNQERIRARLREFEIEMLVIDEAHVISQWGHDFRPEYSNFKQTIENLNPHQILAFTATATKKTLEDIQRTLFATESLIFQADTDRDNICYSTYPVYSKTEGLVELLRTCERPAIVFCQRRRTTYELCFELKRFYPDYEMRYYHAGLSKEERNTIEKWFKETSKSVLFTTCAYGLGVDLPGIRTIIHYDLPEDALEYLQESGRAGRDRKQANAWVLIQYGKDAESPLEQIFIDNKCRRKALLECLGEEKEECSGCDVCKNQVIPYPYGHNEILAFRKRYPFHFSVSKTAGILAGDPFYQKYELNPFFGILNMDTMLLRDTINNMNLRHKRNRNSET